MGSMSRDEVQKAVMSIIENMTQDFDFEFSGGIKPESMLGKDLGFESVDVVELFVAIEQHFKKRGIPFQKLVADAEEYQDISINQIIDFLHQNL